MPREAGVLAVFDDPSVAAKAVRAARAAGHEPVRAAMPAPFPEVMEALAQPKSWIDMVTLGGAVLGMGLGLALTVGTSLALPLRVGGKEVVSLPGFLVVIFEVTVLVGGLSNFIGMQVGAVLARRRSWVPEDARFSCDRIGLFLPGAGDAAEALLRAQGAEEVRRVA
jgi:Protein of unknown function (DUF3341)